MSIGEAVVDIGADTSDFKKDVERGTRGALVGVGREADREGKRGGKALGAGMLATFGKAIGPIAGVVGSIGLGKIALDSIMAASDLDESLNAIRVTYKGAADDVLALGETSAQAFGLSQIELNNFAVQFSSFAGQLASKGKSSADVFTEIAGRATDFASVMNLEVSEAAAAFQSGLAGETEPLKQFGIDLSDAAIQAFAAANGIGETGKQMTEQQKVQARYGLLMQKTADFQGDFQNTSDGLANQLRILKAEWGDLSADLGRLFLPAATATVGLVRDIISPIAEMASGFGSASDSTGKMGETMSAVADFARPLIAQLKELGADIKDVLGPGVQEISTLFREEFLPAFRDILPVIQPIAKVFLDLFGVAVLGAIRGAIDTIKGFIQVVSGLFNAVSGLVTGDWGRMWKGIVQIQKGGLNILKGLFRILWNSIVFAPLRKLVKDVTKLWTSMWSSVTKTTTSATSSVKKVFSSGLNAVRNLVRSVGRAITSVWSGTLSTIRGVTSRGLNTVRGAFSSGLSAARSIVSSAMSRIRSAVSNGIRSVVGVVRGLPGRVRGALGSLGSTLYSSGYSLISGFARGITAGIGSAVSAASSAVSRVRALFPFSPAKEGPFSGRGYTTFSGAALMEDFAKSVKDTAIKVQPEISSALNPLQVALTTPDAPGSRPQPAAPAPATPAAATATAGIDMTMLARLFSSLTLRVELGTDRRTMAEWYLNGKKFAEALA